MTASIAEHGFTIVRDVLSQWQLQNLMEALRSLTGAGKRGLLDVTQVAELARSENLLDLVRPHTGKLARPVRAIYFDKSAHANWLVAWHQDVTIAVEERVDVDGFGPWSVKDGVPHVQAPVEFLEKMLAVRIHLDDCDERNGALRVLSGTHLLGRLSSEQIQQLRVEKQEMVCSARTGDMMLMRPLLLHASGKSDGNGHRRVLHIEYAAMELPSGLRWRGVLSND
jgi:Phytanoyl-CoA dioxygenase (PhyH)